MVAGSKAGMTADIHSLGFAANMGSGSVEVDNRIAEKNIVVVELVSRDIVAAGTLSSEVAVAVCYKFAHTAEGIQLADYTIEVEEKVVLDNVIAAQDIQLVIVAGAARRRGRQDSEVGRTSSTRCARPSSSGSCARRVAEGNAVL